MHLFFLLYKRRPVSSSSACPHSHPSYPFYSQVVLNYWSQVFGKQCSFVLRLGDVSVRKQHMRLYGNEMQITSVVLPWDSV